MWRRISSGSNSNASLSKSSSTSSSSKSSTTTTCTNHLGMKRASSEASFPVVLSYGRLDRLLVAQTDESSVHANSSNSNSSYPNPRTKNNRNSLPPSEQPQKHRLRKRQRQRLRWLWMAHFAWGLGAVGQAVWINNPRGRKYVPAASGWKNHNSGGSLCRKLLVNVMAASGNETDALLCCPQQQQAWYSSKKINKNNNNKHQHPSEPSPATPLAASMESIPSVSTIENPFGVGEPPPPAWMEACPPKRSTLATRLGHPLPALLLPLLPLLIRIAFHLLHSTTAVKLFRLVFPNSGGGCGNGGGGSSWEFYSIPFDTTTLRRLGLYMGLMLIRGFGLYWGLNSLEDSIVRRESSLNTCWYDAYLRNPHDAADGDNTAVHSSSSMSCYGRPFDFSDHMVLYWAQILPMFAMECFYTLLQSPFWRYRQLHASLGVSNNSTTTTTAMNATATSAANNNNNNSANNNNNNNHRKAPEQQAATPFPSRISGVLGPLVYGGGLVYLYHTIWVATHKTSSWFHTPGEVVVGYLVSLIISLPLACLQTAARCEDSDGGGGAWAIRAHDYFFGST